MQKSEDGSARLRVKGMVRVQPDGLVKSQCFWCEKDVELPLRLDTAALPATPPKAPREVLVIRVPQRVG